MTAKKTLTERDVLMSAEKEMELIDGRTLEEWLDIIPVGVESMTKMEREEKLLEVKARVARENEDVSWQSRVYGQPSGTGNRGSVFMTAEPSSSYGIKDDCDDRLRKAIAYQRAGGRFLTKEEFFADLRNAIDGVKNAYV